MGDILTHHHYVNDVAEAAAAALNAGVDLNSGGAWSGFAYLHLNESLTRGLVREAEVRIPVAAQTRGVGVNSLATWSHTAHNAKYSKCGFHPLATWSHTAHTLHTRCGVLI